MNKFLTISTAVALAASSTYLFHLQREISTVPTHQVSSSPHVSDALKQSKAALVVNPKNHVTITDARSTTIELPESVSDEQILARFVKGFFGGYVFGLERGLLKAARKEITRFDQLKDIPVSSLIWSQAEISRETVPLLHSVLFGVFRVADYHVRSTDKDVLPNSSQEDGRSYIDFAFGSDDGAIAGVHRFSVVRDGKADGNGEGGEGEHVTIEFAHVGCNPKENKPLKPDVLQTLHLWYAMLLFREGVAEVMKI